MVEQNPESFMDRRGADDMVIIEHQREGVIEFAQIVNQASQERLGSRWLGRLQHT
jgi:hypothetical protein